MININDIKNWFLSKNSVYFFLPDGPEGRPFDNIFNFESIESEGDRILLSLSDDTEFIFDAGSTNCLDEKKLIINKFLYLKYRKHNKDIKIYQDGELQLIGF